MFKKIIIAAVLVMNLVSVEGAQAASNQEFTTNFDQTILTILKNPKLPCRGIDSPWLH